MAEVYAERLGRLVTDVKLHPEQVEAIRQATGVDVSELSIVELSGDAARAISPSLLKATVAALCW